MIFINPQSCNPMWNLADAGSDIIGTPHNYVQCMWDEKACFYQDFNFFFLHSRSLKCPLHITSYALRIEVSVMELYGSGFLISHTHFKRYSSIARTGNFIMYTLGHFSLK